MDLFAPVAQLPALGLSYFAHCCDQNYSKRETLISFHISRAQPIRHSSRSLRQLVTWQPQSGKQRKTDADAQLAFSCLFSRGPLALGWNDAACV